MDLGADSFQTIRYVILPQLGSALLAGGLRRLFDRPPPGGPDRQCLAAAVDRKNVGWSDDTT